MTFWLYIDDERNVNDNDQRWIVVRNYDQAIDYILTNGMPDYITFDHDLGINTPTGYDVVKKIVELDMDGYIDIKSDFKFKVHSANPVGASNIEKYLDRYLKFKFG